MALPATLPVQRQRYSRYDQEKFITRETEGFNIDTMGSYQGMILKSVVEGINFKHSSRNPSQLGLKPQTPMTKKELSFIPIIIIPAASTSLLSMLNVKEILQRHKFVSTQQKKADGALRKNEVIVHRRSGNTLMPYRVVDEPSKLSAAEWDRVVAAFVLGPAWQFEGWPNGHRAPNFANICAFHLKFEGMKLDVRISRWAVNVLTLNRNHRQLDRAVLGRFWEILDKHMMKNKTQLKF